MYNTKGETKTGLENTSVSDDITNFFENFIKRGVTVKEKYVVPGFYVKLKALSIEEQLMAESILLAANKDVPTDIIIKVRAASILSQAIISVDGKDIEKEGSSEADTAIRRDALYKQILKMPAILVQKTYEFYIETVHEQNEFYSTPEKVSENIENF